MSEQTHMPLIMPQTVGGAHGGIIGIGAYRPRRVVDNAEMCSVIGRTNEWIETRSGIKERRFAARDETLTMMGSEAADRALAHAGVSADDIDLVLLATSSNMLQTPPTSVRIAHELGTCGAAGLDLAAACAGFCHALALASDAVHSGSVGQVLVIGADRMTDLVNPDDHTISFLFADGAGAVVVGRSATPGIGPVVRGADASYFEALRMTSEWDFYADDPKTRDRPWLRMDGRKVFRWAMEEVCPAALRALALAGIGPDSLDAFIPHQANLRITELMAERIGLTDRTTVSRDVVYSGNTSAASVPLAMEALLSAKAVNSGDSALLLGFGAGLGYAGQVVRLP